MHSSRRPCDPYTGHYYLLHFGQKRNCTHCPYYGSVTWLEVRVADVLNAYVMAPNRKKMWRVSSPEFGDNAGKSAIIVRVLYSLKSVGASFRAHLAQ